MEKMNKCICGKYPTLKQTFISYHSDGKWVYECSCGMTSDEVTNKEKALECWNNLTEKWKVK